MNKYQKIKGDGEGGGGGEGKLKSDVALVPVFTDSYTIETITILK